VRDPDILGRTIASTRRQKASVFIEVTLFFETLFYKYYRAFGTFLAPATTPYHQWRRWYFCDKELT